MGIFDIAGDVLGAAGRTLDWKRTLREVASQTAQFPGGKVKKKPKKKKGN